MVFIIGCLYVVLQIVLYMEIVSNSRGLHEVEIHNGPV